ncbi:MAG TPA: putative glycolipid-binding domain-containing protein [Actinomycetota bacterium]|nr:putative glycolipid-binding domain-containing protein [Actinomycetota bacterium]
MPSGRYAVRGRSGDVVGTEDFRCAPGPMGWRYVSEIEREEPSMHREIVDVAVDGSWRVVRTRIETGSHAIMLEPDGDMLVGVRDGEHVEVPWGSDTHLDYLSPAFNAITAQRIADTSEIDVVYLEPVTLEPTTMRQRYELIRREIVDTPAGRFLAVRWRYTALTSGWTSELWVAEDVVVRYDRAFELIAYERGATGPVLVRDEQRPGLSPS